MCEFDAAVTTVRCSLFAVHGTDELGNQSARLMLWCTMLLSRSRRRLAGFLMLFMALLCGAALGLQLPPPAAI